MENDSEIVKVETFKVRFSEQFLKRKINENVKDVFNEKNIETRLSCINNAMYYLQELEEQLKESEEK